MLAEIGPFQALLDAIGWLLAWLYDLTGNFGFAIIILTIVFRVVLLPLGIKQIKSMQAMQALQPKIKEIQKKYKGNKQKIQEQTMKLYQEYGRQPARRLPPPPPAVPHPHRDVRGDPGPGLPTAATARTRNNPRPPAYKDNHLPVDSQLFIDITQQDDDHMHFLFMNLQCSPSQCREDGPRAQHGRRKPSGSHARLRGLDTGPDPLLRVAGLMIGSTYYSSRQTQKATPASAQNPQTQIITKVMPLMFGVFGFAFPAGLILYWTSRTSSRSGSRS